MRQAADKRVFHRLLHYLSLVVVGIVLDVNHGFVHITHSVPQEIDRHHGCGVSLVFPLLRNVFGREILGAQVLAETERFRLQPRLLQFYQNEFLLPVLVPDLGGKVYAEHRERVSGGVCMLVAANLHAQHLLLEQGGEDGPGDAFVLHEKLEHGVINRVGYVDNHILVLLFFKFFIYDCKYT